MGKNARANFASRTISSSWPLEVRRGDPRGHERHEAYRGGGGGREMFRPVALGLCIASCKVTAVKFSAPPLNFSGIPIYSAARYLYLFRASSLSLPLCPPFLPRPNVSRGGSLLSSIPFLARTSLPARTHAHAPLSVLPVSLPLPSPSISPFLSG